MRGTKEHPKWWVNKRCREGKILVVVILTWMMLSLCRKQFGVPNCGDFEGIACNMCSTYMEGIVITSPSSPSSSPLSSHLPPLLSLFLRFYCFVFRSASKEKAYAIVLTVAKAFYLAYQASGHVISVGVVKQ